MIPPGTSLFLARNATTTKFTATTGRDPLTGDQIPLFHPREARWRDHFAWSDDSTEVLVLTPTGRATVEKLRMNRTNRITLRRLLYHADVHPPREDSDL
jgi:hypothetical protein